MWRKTYEKEREKQRLEECSKIKNYLENTTRFTLQELSSEELVKAKLFLYTILLTKYISKYKFRK